MEIIEKAVIIYLIGMNLVTFIVYGIDKRKAIKHKYRIPEKRLLSLVLLGGSVGALLGMYVFRHKTKKMKFTIGLPTILISEIVLIIYFMFFYK